MTKLVIKPVLQRTLREAVTLGGIIVSVYEKRVSFLMDSLHDDDRAGFASVYVPRNCGRMNKSYCTAGGISALVNRVELDNLDGAEYYHFASLKDFAKAVIDNGWISDS